jgi:poly(3-hydroxybutyrate) depolymerase
MPQDLSGCAPQGPLAYVAVSNAQDPRIPYAGGKATLNDANYDVLPAETALATFAKIDGCGAKKDDKPFPEREARKDSKAARGAILSFSGCKAPAELIRVDSSAHRIPGHRPDRAGEPGVDEKGDFDASHAVWEFLRRNGA